MINFIGQLFRLVHSPQSEDWIKVRGLVLHSVTSKDKGKGKAIPLTGRGGP
jgi:hypothetical protein